MLVVHGLYSPDRGAGLWAEDPARPVKSTATTQRSRSHPFAAPLPGAGATAEALLLLPSLPSAPLDSPELLRTPPRPAPRGVPALLPWRVPVLWLEAGQAVRLLGDTGGGDVRFGRSVEYLAAVVAFASDLVDRGRVLPTVDLLETGAAARWRPIVQGPDLLALHRLAAAMPPVCRAEAQDSSDRDGRDPHTLVSAAVDAFVDAVVRSRLAGGPPKDELGVGNAARAAEQPPDQPPLSLLPPRRGRARRTVVEAWLAGLTSWDGVVDAPDDAVDDLAAALAPWDEVGPASGTARLTLRLLAPGPEEPAIDEGVAVEDVAEQGPGGGDGKSADDSDSGGPAWRLEFFLQSTEDPSLLVPAEQIWDGGGSLGRWLDRPEELLLTELGRAGRIYPDLNKALHQARPSQWELDAVGAHSFLADAAPQLDAAGIGLLLPAWWSRRHRLSLRLSAGTPIEGVVEGAAKFGRAQLVDFRWQIAIGDEVLSEDELRALAEAKSPLVRVRGQWLAADPEQLRRGLEFLQRKGSGRMTAGQLLDLAARQDIGLDTPVPVEDVSAQGWLGALLSGAVEDVIADVEPSPDFLAVLRPYQQRGFAYLSFMSRLGLGTCLADDMGLGKTIQLLALLSRERSDDPDGGPTLLVCPMSVVGNWQHEIATFAPALRVYVHHGADRLRGNDFDARRDEVDLVVTTYAVATRDSVALADRSWRRVVLDEAQTVKNSASRQAAAVRRIPAEHRIALTGTPVENRLAELWAVMDFVNPGLLGSMESFRTRFAIPVERYGKTEPAQTLRAITRPYLLRRVKTDPNVIDDLPDKIEVKQYCALTVEQVSLYQAVVDEMMVKIEESEGITRRGNVLAAMAKLKQICNHPAQFLHDRTPLGTRSGKVARLLEILAEIHQAGEKVLCFTQYTEFAGMLQPLLTDTFGREVLYLHGGTPKKRRDEMVARFQTADDQVGGAAPAIFLLSLRAGGTGLNLTAANHVIHLDRWWNPAVENQATDRAFRIGQLRTVEVHKLICTGTLEERIDEMIETKKALADSVVGDGEGWLTELSTSQLREMFALTAQAPDE
ncbi:MAG TPA: DEAD/DEAH box helicase [Nakamurella sp.]|nr:DEAD/DEAH box helicase [Nakamurella sp.]